MDDDLAQMALFPEIRAVEYKPARVLKKGTLIPFEPSERRFVKVVLASASPSKQEVLSRLGLRFEVDPANIDERSLQIADPAELVQQLAILKGLSVCARNPDALILSADTLIVGSEGVIGKPRDKIHALEILSKLNGRIHEVLSGLFLLEPASGRRSVKLVKTLVHFRMQRPEALARYVATGEPMGKAGAYALQGIGALLVEKIVGEYTNVLGLPIAAFVDALADLGYELI